MLFDDSFYLLDGHNHRLVFTKTPRLDEAGQPIQEAFLPNATYAREALEAIIDNAEDPFSNVLVNLWLYMKEKPWDIPATSHQLICDIAEVIGAGELFVYRER